MLYGHRNDVNGYASALVDFDCVLGDFIPKMRDDDLLIITADHGCDPAFSGTDHTRENVPLLCYAKGIKPLDLGGFDSYSCIAKTILQNFSIENDFYGNSFLKHTENGL